MRRRKASVVESDVLGSSGVIKRSIIVLSNGTAATSEERVGKLNVSANSLRQNLGYVVSVILPPTSASMIFSTPASL